VNTVVVAGSWGRVEWARDARGGEPGRVAFEALSQKEQDKLFALCRRLAETGRITNEDQFKSLGASGFGLFEFRVFQVRFLGDFRPGKRFVIAFGVRKKKDKLDRVDMEVAQRILNESDPKT
jgi:Phage derived protein Gp49-like (DUF891)